MARNARSAARVSRAGTVLESTTNFGFAVRHGVLDFGRDL